MPIAQHTRGQRLDADALAAVMGGAAPQPEAGRPPAAAPAAAVARPAPVGAPVAAPTAAAPAKRSRLGALREAGSGPAGSDQASGPRVGPEVRARLNALKVFSPIVAAVATDADPRGEIARLIEATGEGARCAAEALGAGPDAPVWLRQALAAHVAEVVAASITAGGDRAALEAARFGEICAAAAAAGIAATPEAGEPAAFGAQDALSDAVAARLALARAMVPVVEAISPPRFAFWRDRTALAASVAERLMATATRLAEDAAPDEEGPAARRIALGALLGHAGRAYAAAHNAEAAKAVRKLSALAPDARQATQRRHEAAGGIDMAPVWAEFDRRMGCIAAALAVTATPEADRRARP